MDLGTNQGVTGTQYEQEHARHSRQAGHAVGVVGVRVKGTLQTWEARWDASLQESRGPARQRYAPQRASPSNIAHLMYPVSKAGDGSHANGSPATEGEFGTPHGSFLISRKNIYVEDQHMTIQTRCDYQWQAACWRLHRLCCLVLGRRRFLQVNT